MKETLSDTISPELILTGPQSKLAREIHHRATKDAVLKAKMLGLFSGSKFERLSFEEVNEIVQSKNLSDENFGKIESKGLIGLKLI